MHHGGIADSDFFEWQIHDSPNCGFPVRSAKLRNNHAIIFTAKLFTSDFSHQTFHTRGTRKGAMRGRPVEGVAVGLSRAFSMNRVFSVALLALVVGDGISGYSGHFRDSSPQYRFARAELGPLTAAVSATGNVNAVISVQVGSQVSGQIKDLLVDFNSVVKKGQVVARIDPASFEAKVTQAKADVDAARAAVLNQQAQVERSRADVENARAAHAEARAQTAKAQVAMLDAKRDFDRKTKLFAQQLIAKSDLDTSQAAHDSAGAQLEAAQAHVEPKDAALKQAQVDLDHTTIRAPVQGVVVSRQVDVGQTVAASLQAPVLFTIAQDLTKMQVEASVDEADIGRIKLDDRAAFTVDAFPGETFVGSVAQLRKAAHIVQNVVTCTLVVAVANPGRKLLPGMTANVKLVVAEKPSVLKVPNAALRFRPAGAEAGGPSRPLGGAPPSTKQARDRRVKDPQLAEDHPKKLAGRVWVLGSDGKPAPVEIALGLSDGSSTEVLRGDLKEGQEVIVGLAVGAGQVANKPKSERSLRL